MTDRIYDASNPLPAPQPGAEAALVLPDEGTTFVNLTIFSDTGKAIQADLKQQIMLGSAAVARAKLNAIEFKTGGSSLYNQGSISSITGSGILFSGGGLGTVTNLGSIVGTTGIAVASSASEDDRLSLFNAGDILATGLAVQGGFGADVIVNTGTLRTTGDVLLDLGAGDDIYDGTRGIAIGTIKLGAGNDTAYGGMGSETFSGGLGDNYIDGGGGIDTVDYSDATNGLTIDLRTKAWQHTGRSPESLDFLVNIENLIGSDYSDTFIGDSGDNLLDGGAGDDILEGGQGTDILIGGEGNDTVRYLGSSGAYVDLKKTGRQYTGGYGWDTLIGIENLEGGSGADSFLGNELANKLSGFAGNDTLEGREGNDTLIGGAGNDTLIGGAGDDTLDGGDGNDMAVFSGSKDDYEFPSTAPVAGNTFTVTHKSGGADGVDTLKNIRFLKFKNGTATETDDVIVALYNQDPTSISLSKTTVAENTATDTFVAHLLASDPDGDKLTFTLDNSAGGRFKLDSTGTKILVADGALLDYEKATSHTITVTAKDGYGGTLTKTLKITITNVYETTPVVRHGTAASEQVVGEYGNDRLYGLGGNDQVFGQSGNDTLYGGAGNDTLIGGAGKDVFVLDTRPNVKTNLDWIYDFNPRDDTIYLPRSIFTALPKGVLARGAFVTGDQVYDKDDRIIYHKKAGALFYDPDGTGSAQAVQIAWIGKNLAITHADFVVI